VRIDRVEGSFWEPLVLVHSYWNYEGANHAVTRVEIARIEAVLLWQKIFRRGGERWFQRLSLRGVQGKIKFPLDASTGRDTGVPWRERIRVPDPIRLSMPEVIVM